MNKKVFGKKLSRSRPAREALFSSLSRAMILEGKIITTKAKAKAVLPDLEKFITLAKKGDIAARRRALSMLDNARGAADLLFQKWGKVFAGRISGFVRLTNLPRRKGDNAEMVRVEWTENPLEPKAKKAKVASKVESK